MNELYQFALCFATERATDLPGKRIGSIIYYLGRFVCSRVAVDVVSQKMLGLEFYSQKKYFLPIPKRSSRATI